MSAAEFDTLKRQFASILRSTAAAQHSSAYVLEQYAGMIEAGSIPSAITIAQIQAQIPQFASPFAALGASLAEAGKKKRKGKGDLDVIMFDVTSPTEDGDSKKRKRVRKEKAPKDPNAPKRPPSAYLLYQNAIRKEIKDQNPNLTYAEVLGEISKMWSGLDTETKKPYLDATEIAKGEYEKNKVAYDAGLAAQKSPPAAAVATPAADIVDDAPADSSEEDESDEPVRAPVKPAVVAPITKPTKANAIADKKKKESLGGKAVHVPPPPIKGAQTSDDDASESSDEDSESSDEPPPPKKKTKKDSLPPPAPAKKDKKRK